MSKRSSIVYLTLVLVFIFAASGCSSADIPTSVPSSRAAGIQMRPGSHGSWTTKAPMPTARWELAAGVINDTLYVVGGHNSGIGYLNVVEAYDPATNTWASESSMPTTRANLATRVVGRRLFAVGGYNGSRTFHKVEAFNPRKP